MVVRRGPKSTTDLPHNGPRGRQSSAFGWGIESPLMARTKTGLNPSMSATSTLAGSSTPGRIAAEKAQQEGETIVSANLGGFVLLRV